MGYRDWETTETVKGNADAIAAHLADTAQDNVHGLGNRPMVSTEVKTYYIDAVNGIDTNNGITAETAFKTWEKTKTMIPRFLLHKYTVKIIGNLSDDILIDSITGPAILYIEGNTTTPSNQVLSLS